MHKLFVYESLNDYVKPKSQEEIRKSLKNLSPQKKLEQGCKHGILWLVQEALDEGADPSNDHNRAIRWASNHGYIDVVKLLLQDPRVDPGDDNNNTIRWAAINGSFNIVKLLLQHSKVDPANNNNAPIIYASELGHIDVIQLLLQDPRVDPSDSDNDAIKRASHNHLKDVVRLLLKDPRIRNKLSKEQIEYYEWQSRGYKGYIKESLTDYVKPKSKEQIRKTISHYSINNQILFCCKHGLLNILKEISKKHNVNLNVLTNHVYPIKLALWSDQIDIVKFLIDYGVDLTFNKNDLLWHAIKYNMEVVKILLTKKEVLETLPRMFKEHWWLNWDYERKLKSIMKELNIPIHETFE